MIMILQCETLRDGSFRQSPHHYYNDGEALRVFCQFVEAHRELGTVKVSQMAMPNLDKDVEVPAETNELLRALDSGVVEAEFERDPSDTEGDPVQIHLLMTKR